MRVRATLASPSVAAAPGLRQPRVGDDARLQQQSGWHSPVPYLFGGLAAMMGLIAFALLILACSYWKLSGHLDSGEGDAESGGDGEKEGGGGTKAEGREWDNKVLVIMAGQVMPTFLATPSTSRSSSFGGGGGGETVCDESSGKKEKVVVVELSGAVVLGGGGEGEDR